MIILLKNVKISDKNDTNIEWKDNQELCYETSQQKDLCTITKLIGIINYIFESNHGDITWSTLEMINRSRLLPQRIGCSVTLK